MCIGIPIFADDIAESEECFLVRLDILSDVPITHGINSSLVIITEVIIMPSSIISK